MTKRPCQLVAVTAMLTLILSPLAFAAKMTPNEREALKRAQYHLGSVERESPNIDEMTTAITSAEDITKVKYGGLLGLNALLADLNQKLTNVESALKQTSPDAPEVAKIKSSVDDLRKKLAGAGRLTDDTIAKLDKIRDIANYPKFADDFDKLKALTSAYADVNALKYNVPVAVDLASQWPATLSWYQETFTTYRPLMQQGTTQGNAFYTAATHFGGKIKDFQAAAGAFAQESPAEIADNLKRARDMASKAVEKRTPGFFTGGVQQCMTVAEDRLTVLAALAGESNEKVVNLRKEVDAAKADMNKARTALIDDIIAATKSPEDQYKGNDAAKLKSMIRDQWEKNHPDDDILGVHLIAKDWHRETGWQWNTGYKRWEFYDRSHLRARVVVKHDSKTASIHVAYANQNHQSNVLSVGAHTKDSAYVTDRMLLANYKK